MEPLEDPEEPKQSWERTKLEASHSWFQTILQTYSNQNSMILALKTNM